MNELYKKIILVLAGGLIAIATMLVSTVAPPVKVGGSSADVYNATTTTSQLASGSQTWLIKRGPGILGSVIIASTTPDSIYIGSAVYVLADSTYGTTSASTTPVLSFPRSAAAGTYVFDRPFVAGLSVSIPAAFNGVYIVTYK